MHVISKLTLRSMSKNRKQTGVVLLGIILATALMTAVGILFTSFLSSMLSYEKAYNGDYHYVALQVEPKNWKYFENNRKIEEIGYVRTKACFPTLFLNKGKYLNLPFMNETALKQCHLQLEQGRFPENSSEAVVCLQNWDPNNGTCQLGDVLKVSVGELRYNKELTPGEEGYSHFEIEQEKELTIVGILEASAIRERFGQPDLIVGWDAENDRDACNLYLTYEHKALLEKEVLDAEHAVLCEGEEKIAEEIMENPEVLKWERLDLFNETLKQALFLAGFALAVVVVTSVFCVRNGFTISVTEKLRLYGMLSSVGMTRSQMCRMVYTEALYLCLIGIPIGVCSGCAAVWLLLQATGELIRETLKIQMIYSFSAPAALAGGLLSLGTILFSAVSSAERAAKMEPLRAIREADTGQFRKKKICGEKTAAALFGIGGRLACKNRNFQRSKYRTTTISIAVSVTVFIALSYYMGVASRNAREYYQEKNYNIRIMLNFAMDQDTDAQEEEMLNRILSKPGIRYAEIVRGIYNFRVFDRDLKYSEAYLRDHDEERKHMTGGTTPVIPVYTLGDSVYEQYCKRVGVSVKEAEDKGILIADYHDVVTDENGKTRKVQGLIYTYRKGDVISGKCNELGGRNTAERECSIPLAAMTDQRPEALEGHFKYGSIVVSEKWRKAHKELFGKQIDIYLICEDADAMENALAADSVLAGQYGVTNLDQEYRHSRSLQFLTGVFLYGFLTVVCLIGITNMLNTVTADMELRAREFAMLRSIGMTDFEFYRMIALEHILYGAKALGIGILFGCTLTVYVYWYMKNVMLRYLFPWKEVLWSIVGTAGLLTVIVWYCAAKIKQKNLMETIRKDAV